MLNMLVLLSALQILWLSLQSSHTHSHIVDDAPAEIFAKSVHDPYVDMIGSG